MQNTQPAPLVLGEVLQSMEELEKRGYVLMDDEDFPVINHINDRLKERNLSASELARLTGTSRQNINAVTRNKMRPGIDLCLRMAYVLDTTVEDLFELRESAWIEQKSEYKDAAIYLNTKTLEVIGMREKNKRVKQDFKEYWNMKTGDLLTKADYDKAQKEFIEKNYEDRKQRVAAANEGFTHNEILAATTTMLKEEFNEVHQRLYKKIGFRFKPYQIPAPSNTTEAGES